MPESDDALPPVPEPEPGGANEPAPLLARELPAAALRSAVGSRPAATSAAVRPAACVRHVGLRGPVRGAIAATPALRRRPGGSRARASPARQPAAHAVDPRRRLPPHRQRVRRVRRTQRLVHSWVLRAVGRVEHDLAERIVVGRFVVGRFVVDLERRQLDELRARRGCGVDGRGSGDRQHQHADQPG